MYVTSSLCIHRRHRSGLRMPAAAPAPTTSTKARTIRIVVGFSAGGGFDTYARAIARHMGKHIPGIPSIVVENMTGAGSLIAANHVYQGRQTRRPDHRPFHRRLVPGPGTRATRHRIRRAQIRIHRRADQRSRRLRADQSERHHQRREMDGVEDSGKDGRHRSGTSTPDNATRILKAAFGLPIQLVTGYKGTADVRLAAESGEVAGGCWGWDSVSVTWRKALDSGDAVVVLQANRQKSSRPAEYSASDQVRQDRRSPQDDRRRHPRRQRHRANLHAAAGNTEGPRAAAAQSLRSDAERSRVRRRRQKISAQRRPHPRGRNRERHLPGCSSSIPRLVTKLKDVLYN